jgi:hypothetical protein
MTSSPVPPPPPPPAQPPSPEMSPTRLRKNISDFTEEKQLTLVIADLFEGIAQEQRAAASKMKSLRACRNFRVDVRGSNYFLCQCGHAKSAHAFSPLPEDDLFVGSTGITPKVINKYMKQSNNKKLRQQYVYPHPPYFHFHILSEVVATCSVLLTLIN